jgi:segregation and condensation protein B
MNLQPSDHPDDLKRVLEAALLVAVEPLSLNELKRMFEHDASSPGLSNDMLRRSLDELRVDWQGKGVELVQVADGWRFQTRPEMQPWLTRLKNEKPPRYSRAVLETLAIIAYRQPVTRGDIEDIRGVSVSTDIVKTLLGREWIRQVGIRNVPGRPALYGTTREFLEHFNLKNLEELPPLSALRDLEVIGDELNLRLDLEPGADASAPSDDASGHSSPVDGEHEPEPAIMNEAQAAERE